MVFDRNGIIRGGAEAYCMRDEPNWRQKPIHQLISMAGTRAVSKSLRLLLSWVVVLAGYDPTPYEELAGSQPVEAKQRQQPPQETAPSVPESHGDGPKPAEVGETPLAQLKACRIAYSVSPSAIVDYAITNFMTNKVEQLSEAQIDMIIGAIVNGEIKPEAPPAGAPII